MLPLDGKFQLCLGICHLGAPLHFAIRVLGPLNAALFRHLLQLCLQSFRLGLQVGFPLCQRALGRLHTMSQTLLVREELV